MPLWGGGKGERMRMGCVLGVIALLVCGAGAAEREGWRLVWADEFDRPGMPDPAKWTYEKGFVRNREAQFYTVARRENARVENGCLVIEGRKETFANPGHKPGSEDWREAETAAYTSASLTTEGLFAVTYGRVEVRAKLPRGRGMWPAIWMLGTSFRSIGWPRCGEIDIMEFVGHAPATVHANVHWFDTTQGKRTSLGGKLHDQKPSDDFHLYVVERFEDRMDFYYDDTLYHRFLLDKAGAGEDNPFRKPHYLLINLAIGGAWGGQKGIDDAMLPQTYEIDYVRVYQRAP
jgi:beta-glucanase (GH16 family)